MSIIGFNPAASTAATANRSLKDSTSPDTKSAAPFVRSDNSSDADSVPARRLQDFTQVQGMIPLMDSLKEGFIGSINELRKTIGKGDIAGAKALLAEIGTYKLGVLFQAEGTDPNILKNLKVALTSSTNPAEILKNVDRTLKEAGFKPTPSRSW